MAWLSSVYFGNTLRQYLLFFSIILSAFLIGKVILWVSANIIRKAAAKTKTKLDDLLLDVTEGPLVFLITVIALWFADQQLTLSVAMATRMGNVVKMLLAADVGWFLVRLVDAMLVHYVQPLTAKTKTDLDDHLLPFMRKLIKILIVAMTLVVILDNAGYDVGTLLAGLGIGGLAFALAAKDLLANIFGGLTVIFDKPFRLGDRIKIGDHEGFVREIGMRTTRIETLASTQVIVPNSKVTESFVENVSREQYRRILFKLGITYDTPPGKVKRAKEIVLDVLSKHKNIASKDEKPPKVAFTEFADFSLNIQVLYWMKDTTLYFETQDEVNSQILERFNKAGIEFAFPTRTIYTKKG
ncbi:mechanosensitive ion channel protein MscL [Candidatus Woesearchaeota archaeon CG_4_10_14_0_2_um_filter_57_5]|nr:MAG: mechanosensitive ion channel protein MscL [Candidatus Woesearchaeota archaeon CG_4_10_14_0_2_um_filter_57_5]